MNDKERAELESLRLVAQAIEDYAGHDDSCSLCGSSFGCLGCEDVIVSLEEHKERMAKPNA